MEDRKKASKEKIKIEENEADSGQNPTQVEKKVLCS